MSTSVNFCVLLDSIERVRFLLPDNAMEEKCTVICGEWLCGGEGNWNFVVDKHHMAVLVPVYEEISLKELQSSFLPKFNVDEALCLVSLSYWSA